MREPWVKEFLSWLPGFVFWKDCDGTYLWGNVAFASQFGFSSTEEVVGKSDKDMPWSDSLESIKESDRKVISSRKTFVFEESGILIQKIPIISSDNSIVGILGISCDGFEGKGSAVQVLEDIVALMPGHVYWKNRNCVLQGCNDEQAKDAGLSSRHDIVGKTAYDLLWGDQSEEEKRKQAQITDEIDHKIMDLDEPETVEEFAFDLDGKKKHYISRKVPIKDKENEVIGLVGISVDVTEEKKRDRELIRLKTAEKSSEVKSEFIANMSHDLRTPMTGVIGMLQELSYLEQDIQKALGDQPEVLECLDDFVKKAKQNVSIAKESADILLEMFNDILETVRLDSGQVDAEPEHFNVSFVIQRKVNLLQATASDKQLELSIQIADTIPAVFGLKRLLDRILLNLISNALKFTKEGSVTVSASCVDKSPHESDKKAQIEIRVSDTGIGIPEDKFGEIFDNFSRLTSSYRGVYKGSGLGLYAVKRYVEAMDGEIRVESKEGKGSTFILNFLFDVSDQDVNDDSLELALLKPIQPNEKAMNPPVIAPSSGGARILITEDNVSAAMVVQGMLSRLGYQADHAKTGQEAIDFVTQNDYKLVLMDIGLPDMTGLDAAVAIRQLDHPKRRKVPIVALTGHVDKRGVCLDAGMQDLLNKPAKLEDIERMLMTYLVSSDKPVDELLVLDLKESIAALGSEETARSVIKTCADDLQDHKDELVNAFKERSTQKLRDIMHYMKGGVCYIKAPALMHGLESFHTAVKEEPQDAETLETRYQALLIEIDRFVEEVNSQGK